MKIQWNLHRMRIYAALAILPLLLSTGHAMAGVLAYQSQSAFNAALAGKSFNVSNFDAIAANTSYSSGTGPAGSGFSLTLGGPDAGSALPAVANQFWTTSGSNYLGLNNSDTALEAGDTLTFNFATPVRGFGLYVIGDSDLGAGDVGLTANGVQVATGTTADMTDGNGSFAFFIGLASDDASLLSSITLNVLDPSNTRFLAISLDDVALVSDQGGTGVPEPAAIPLLALGAVVMSRRLRKRA